VIEDRLLTAWVAWYGGRAIRDGRNAGQLSRRLARRVRHILVPFEVACVAIPRSSYGRLLREPPRPSASTSSLNTTQPYFCQCLCRCPDHFHVPDRPAACSSLRCHTAHRGGTSHTGESRWPRCSATTAAHKVSTDARLISRHDVSQAGSRFPSKGRDLRLARGTRGTAKFSLALNSNHWGS
jgi:hypothetical protein